MSAPPVNSDSSQSAVTNKINDIARDVQALQTTQIFKDDSGTRRVLLGKGANGFYGLKVSKDGKDVYEAANSDLVFNSGQNMFKIAATGTVNLPVVTSPNVGSITVNTGVATDTTLAYDCFLDTTATGGYLDRLPLIAADVLGTGSVIRKFDVSGFVDAGTMRLLFLVTNNAGISTSAWPVRWYVFQETAV